jgi:guanylate kinase
VKSELERVWAEGKAVVFDVDVVGGLNLKNILGDQALAIFVEAPSIEALEERLRNRKTESEEKIQLRIAKAKKEMESAREFDVIIVNDNLESAFHKAETVVANFIQK